MTTYRLISLIFRFISGETQSQQYRIYYYFLHFFFLHRPILESYSLVNRKDAPLIATLKIAEVQRSKQKNDKAKRNQESLGPGVLPQFTQC